MLSDKELASLGYEAMRESVRQMGEVYRNPTPWRNLPNEDMVVLTDFATAIRKLVLNDDCDKIESIPQEEKRFREAVDFVFHKIPLDSRESVAAWYTIQDWLKEHPTEDSVEVWVRGLRK